MATEVQIFNLCLKWLGSDKPIASFSEASKAAAIANDSFAVQRDYVLRDFPWPFATRYKTLNLVDGLDEAYNEDYQYAYRYPAGCLFVRRIVTALGRTDPHPPAFAIAEDDQGGLILTDVEDAKIEYTHAVTDAGRFDPMFVVMLAWKLASVAAPSLSRVEKMAETAMKMYEIEKTKAQSRAANEGQTDTENEPDASWIEAR
jgi:hypothetical protein